jgi:AraC-like DNA-binding protein
LECERRDPFLSMLSALLLRAVVREERTDWRLFVEQFTLSVLAYFAERYGGLRARDCVIKSGLAPWQERRSKEMMRASLDSDLSIAAIAAQCRLTPSHFGRYFKRSTGVTPNQYLTRLRLEEAKRLMLTSRHWDRSADTRLSTLVGLRASGCRPTWPPAIDAAQMGQAKPSTRCFPTRTTSR